MSDVMSKVEVEHPPECPEKCRLYLRFAAKEVRMAITLSQNIGCPPLPSEYGTVRALAKWLEKLSEFYETSREQERAL